MVLAPATRPGEGTGGSEGSGADSRPASPQPTPAALPAEKRPACISPPCPHHAGPRPLPASSSWCFREECTKATVVSTNTGIHCPQLPEGPAGLGRGSQPGPELQQAVSTRQLALNSLRRFPGPQASRQTTEGPSLWLPPHHPDPSASSVSSHCPWGSGMSPPSSVKVFCARTPPTPTPGLRPQELPKPLSLHTEVLAAGSSFS